MKTLGNLVIPLILVLYFEESKCGVGETLRGIREWRKNTNFGNANNWEGLGDVNCSSNIFSFPEWMDLTVMSWPDKFIGKQIILPSHGHFVFQSGIATLSDQGGCQNGREVKFLRTSKADWFNPLNWEGKGMGGGQGEGGIPHVERVPCQFDTVRFPNKSTFNLKIEQNVGIGKFMLGDEVKSYTDLAIIMGSDLGKLQFQKPPEVEFNLTNLECGDDEGCICDNYKPHIKQKICSTMQCNSVLEECYNPILPHGFCCPICGFHIKIKHSGGIKLGPIATHFKTIIPASVDFFITRYAPGSVHWIVAVGKGEVETGLNILGQGIPYLKTLAQVEETSWSSSWEHVPSDLDKWTSGGLGGVTLTFLVLLIISILLALLYFIYNKSSNGRYAPPMFLSSISNLIPSFPTIHIPNINLGGGLSGLLGGGQTNAGGSTTFGFARFSNERVSTVNITRDAGTDGSSVHRGEPVDDVLEKVTEVPQEPGFSSVTYDLIAGETGAGAGIGMQTLTHAATSGSGSGLPPAKPERTMMATSAASEKKTEEEPIYNESLLAVADGDQVSASALLIPGLDEE